MGTKGRARSHQLKGLTTTLVPVRCIHCRAQTVLRLPGPPPWVGARFEDPGWSILNEPEEGHAVFACGPCFEKEMAAQEKSGHPQIRGEG